MVGGEIPHIDDSNNHAADSNICNDGCDRTFYHLQDVPVVSLSPIHHHSKWAVEVEIDNLVATKEQRHPISFTAAPSTVGAIIGPEGSGKSSLLLAIAGRMRPIAGSIRYSKFIKPPRIQYIPSRDISYGCLTVDQKLMAAAALSQPSLVPSERRRRVTRLEGFVQLQDKIHVKIKSLSSVDLRRVTIAEQLLYDPAVLLVDNPINNLGLSDSVLIMECLSNIANVCGVTVITALRFPRLQVLSFLSRVTVLSANGRMIAHGTQPQVRETIVDAVHCNKLGEDEFTDFVKEILYSCPQSSNIQNRKVGDVCVPQRKLLKRFTEENPIVCSGPRQPHLESSPGHVVSEFFIRFFTLIKCYSSNVLQNRYSLLPMCAVNIAMAMVVGSFFFNVLNNIPYSDEQGSKVAPNEFTEYLAYGMNHSNFRPLADIVAHGVDGNGSHPVLNTILSPQGVEVATRALNCLYVEFKLQDVQRPYPPHRFSTPAAFPDARSSNLSSHSFNQSNDGQPSPGSAHHEHADSDPVKLSARSDGGSVFMESLLAAKLGAEQYLSQNTQFKPAVAISDLITALQLADYAIGHLDWAPLEECLKEKSTIQLLLCIATRAAPFYDPLVKCVSDMFNTTQQRRLEIYGGIAWPSLAVWDKKWGHPEWFSSEENTLIDAVKQFLQSLATCGHNLCQTVMSALYSINSGVNDFLSTFLGSFNFFAAIYFACVIASLSGFDVMLTFPEERALMNEESKRGYYNILTAFFAKNCVDLVVFLVPVLLFSVIFFAMINPGISASKYMTYHGIMVVIVYASTGIGYMMVTILKKRDFTFLAGAFIYVFGLSFGSLLLNGDESGAVLNGLSKMIGMFHYGFTAMVANHFGVTEDTPTLSEAFVFSVLDVDSTPLVSSICMCLALGTAYRLVACVAIVFLHRSGGPHE